MAKAIALQHEIVSGPPGIDTLRAKAYSSFLGHGPRLVQPVFGATITIDCSQGSYFQIIATASTAITISAPTNVPNCIGFEITIEVENASGGAMGSVTLNAAYKSPATAPFSTPPANTKQQIARWINIGTQAAPVWHMLFNQSSDSSN